MGRSSPEKSRIYLFTRWSFQSPASNERKTDAAVVYHPVQAMSTLGKRAIRLAYFGYHGANQLASQSNNSERCFRPGKDIVIPSMDDFTTEAKLAWESQEPGNATAAARRSVILQFAGEIVGSNIKKVAVDGGAEMVTKQLNVRQAVYSRFRKFPGFEIGPPSDQNQNFYRMQRSKFCLAPAGRMGHWGRRVAEAALLGCVPIIIQDDYEQPFERYLPYERFSVRVKEAD
eukprot:gene2255-2972_t